jgi:hypothetical protein
VSVLVTVTPNIRSVTYESLQSQNPFMGFSVDTQGYGDDECVAREDAEVGLRKEA